MFKDNKKYRSFLQIIGQSSWYYGTHNQTIIKLVCFELGTVFVEENDKFFTIRGQVADATCENDGIGKRSVGSFGCTMIKV